MMREIGAESFARSESPGLPHENHFHCLAHAANLHLADVHSASDGNACGIGAIPDCDMPARSLFLID
jgi:hypothetical protein